MSVSHVSCRSPALLARSRSVTLLQEPCGLCFAVSRQGLEQEIVFNKSSIEDTALFECNPLMWWVAMVNLVVSAQDEIPLGFKHGYDMTFSKQPLASSRSTSTLKETSETLADVVVAVDGLVLTVNNDLTGLGLTVSMMTSSKGHSFVLLGKDESQHQSILMTNIISPSLQDGGVWSQEILQFFGRKYVYFSRGFWGVRWVMEFLIQTSSQSLADLGWLIMRVSIISAWTTLIGSGEIVPMLCTSKWRTMDACNARTTVVSQANSISKFLRSVIKSGMVKMMIN